MRQLVFSLVAAVTLVAAFSSCSTTVKTDNDHAVSAGVHAR